MILKYEDGMTNSVDPDQAAPSGAIRSGPAMFAQIYLSKYLEYLQYFNTNKTFEVCQRKPNLAA